MNQELLSLNQASKWATNYLDRTVTPSNISYLIQYAKVRRFNEDSKIKIDKKELKEYYDEFVLKKQEAWKKRLGKDLNWNLSFAHLRESDTTKHVHRLHPYKGKFIPQLVEYFLGSHINTFKKKAFFKPGNIILDPFMGSGTTLIQASELGMHSIGIDVSEFNCLMSKVKLDDYDIFKLSYTTKNVLFQTRSFSKKTFDDSFDNELKKRLSEFNKQHFPNPEFKNKVKKEQIDEKEYGEEKLKLFLKENEQFFEKNGSKLLLAKAHSVEI